MSNRLLKYDMSKTDHLISPLKPVSLPLFSNFVNTNTIHPLTQVPNLRVILNSCFSYTPVNLWTSPIISCHHDRALICPLLINSAIIIPGPATEISDLNNWNRLEGVTQSETHRQEPLISSPQQHKNLEPKQKSATSLMSPNNGLLLIDWFIYSLWAVFFWFFVCLLIFYWLPDIVLFKSLTLCYFLGSLPD